MFFFHSFTHLGNATQHDSNISVLSGELFEGDPKELFIELKRPIKFALLMKTLSCVEGACYNIFKGSYKRSEMVPK
jgi:hypothetical protein